MPIDEKVRSQLPDCQIVVHAMLEAGWVQRDAAK